MSSGDVPRCPTCGVYLYPSDTGQFHACGNTQASYPLADWRDVELERLRRELAVRDAEKAALLVANDDAHRWLAEARGLLNSAVFWVRPHNGELARVIDALLAKHEVPSGSGGEQ